MPELLFQRLQQYASRHELRLAEKLGSGIHGLVHLALKEDALKESALTAHQELATYLKESAAYLRLQRAGVHQIHGLHVPQLLTCDSELQVIEMSIVRKPYLLDFAGISLDHPAEFPEEVWREWEEGKREQFGNHWRIVQKVIAELEGFGIYLTDVSPSNIALD